jgi:hypothetical protein
MPKILSDSWCPSSVIPANAGIQVFQPREARTWTPAFAGATTREARVLRTKLWTSAITPCFQNEPIVYATGATRRGRPPFSPDSGAPPENQARTGFSS